MAVIDTVRRTASRLVTGSPEIVEDEPRPLLAGGEGAEICALARLGLGRDDARELLAGPGKTRGGGGGTVEIVPERHGGKHRLGVMAVSERSQVAQGLFAPLGPTYDRWSRLLSLGQDPRWRRFLVSRIEAGARRRGARRRDGHGGCRDRARPADGLPRRRPRPERRDARRRTPAGRGRGLDGAYPARRGSADQLPFEDGSFDGLTFTYLLRYVEEPAATLRELARVVKPGGTIAALEFGLPRGLWRPLWELYVRVGLPVAGRLISPGWHEVGAFLGPSIRELHARLADRAPAGALARARASRTRRCAGSASAAAT